MTRQLTRNFNEAYMLMKYVGNSGEVEWLWNGRDGVTPFGVQSRDGAEILNHADWGEDAFVPNFVPPVGMRIFVSMTMPKALSIARKRVEKSWDSGEYQMKDHPALGPLGKDGAAEALAKEYCGKGDQPTVETVTEGLHMRFKDLARDEPFKQPRRPA